VSHEPENEPDYVDPTPLYKAVPPHAMEELVGRGDVAPSHSRPRH
jgi:hypothetical protein